VPAEGEYMQLVMYFYFSTAGAHGVRGVACKGRVRAAQISQCLATAGVHCALDSARRRRCVCKQGQSTSVHSEEHETGEANPK